VTAVLRSLKTMSQRTVETLFMQSVFASESDAGAERELFVKLVAQSRAGDRAAFEQIMICTQHTVVRIAWRMLGDPEDARDAAQETFLRAYKYLHRFDPERDFNAWLYGITVNVCRRMLKNKLPRERTSAIEKSSEGDVITDERRSADDAEAQIALNEQRRIVRLALGTLSRRERAAVVLRDMEEFSTEEVARILGTRPATVRSQLSAARSKIKLYCERVMREKGSK
jgi:RNA polymerase sigma-70 factor, ECF subfamily